MQFFIGIIVGIVIATVGIVPLAEKLEGGVQTIKEAVQ